MEQDIQNIMKRLPRTMYKQTFKVWYQLYRLDLRIEKRLENYVKNFPLVDYMEHYLLIDKIKGGI